MQKKKLTKLYCSLSMRCLENNLNKLLRDELTNFSKKHLPSLEPIKVYLKDIKEYSSGDYSGIWKILPENTGTQRIGIDINKNLLTGLKDFLHADKLKNEEYKEALSIFTNIGLVYFLAHVGYLCPEEIAEKSKHKEE